MKRFLAALLLLLLLLASFPLSAAGQDISLLYAVKEEGSYTYRLTFSAPVHLFKTGWVWLREKNPEDGNNQVALGSVKYVGETTVTKGTDTYSDVIELIYPEPVPAFDITAYGISIVEYFLDDKNAGYICPEVICGANGEKVKANKVSGGLDFLYIPTDKRDPSGDYPVHITLNRKPVTLLLAAKSAEKQLRLVFSEAVTLLNDGITNITASSVSGEVKAVSAAYEHGTKNSTSILVTFGSEIDGVSFSVPEGCFKDYLSENVPAVSGKTADFKQKEGKDVKIEEGKLYSFMNCDTGRLLSSGGTEEFRLFRAEGKNEWFLRDAEAKKYLSLDSGKAEWSDAPVSVTLYLDNDYDRVQLRVSGGAFVLADDDGGKTAEASLAVRPFNETYIETGWYLTKHGDALPVRVAMVGDSITNGCCPDGDTPKAGCRAKLSEELIKKYGRVVFVGSAVASHGGDGSGGAKSHLDEPFLYREEGHNGWVVESQKGYAPANNYAILSVRENLQKKYQPDVICMMLGINDISQLGMDNVISDKNGIGTAFFGRWENLVKLMLADLPENGKLIIGSLTPWGSGGSWNSGANQMLEKINPMYEARVAALAKEDARICFTDNYAFVHQAGPSAISSDGVHLSKTGYSAMADSYLDAVNKVMDSVTRREAGEDTWKAATEAAVTIEQAESLPYIETEKSSELLRLLPIIALFIGGGALVGITTLMERKKKNMK